MPSMTTFHRSAADAKLAGVCGGVAERWGLDPVLVRVGFVLLALTGGIGVVLYAAGWLLLPVAGTDRAVVDDLFGGAAARWPRELWLTLVVVACILSFVVLGAASPFGVGPGLALAALWWFGFHRPRARRARRDSSAPAPYAVAPMGHVAAAPPAGQPWSDPATPFGQAAAAWQARVAEVRSGVWSQPTWPVAPPAAVTAPLRPMPPAPPVPPVAPVAPVPPVLPVAPVDPVRADVAPATADDELVARAAFLADPDPVGLYAEPAPVPVVRPGTTLAARRLRLVTVTALGLTWLGLGIADALGVAVGTAVYAGAGLLVVALGLVAATRFGRARGLLPAGAVLAVAAVLASGLAGPTLTGPAREATGRFAHPLTYTSAAAFPVDGDHLDTGDLQVDLSGLALTSDATYRAVVDTGRIVVKAPPGTGVALRYDVDTGDVEAYGRHVASGSELRGDPLVVPPAAGQPTLTLDLTIDTGLVEVRS